MRRQRRDSVDQATAVGSGNEIVFCVYRQSADVGLVALEEEGAGSVLFDTENLSSVTGCDVNPSL